MAKILDCTIRDGGYLNDWNFSKDEFLSYFEIAKCAGINYFEIGYRSKASGGNFRRCLPEEICENIELVKLPKLLVMLNASEFDESLFVNSSKDIVSTVRVACHNDEIEQSLRICELLFERGYEVFLHIMNVKDLTQSDFNLLSNWTGKSKILSLYFADSYGSFFNSDVEYFYNKFKECGFEKISFHAHNNLEMALSNTLKAIELGAYCVDVTTGGIGRGGGNLAAELLLSVLKKNDIEKIYKIYSKTSNLQNLKTIVSGVLNLHPTKIDEFITDKTKA